ncbi:MAG: DUF4423 domain-containing protein, partial [Chitinispirillaceae bacterium]|nr:DUF4423 domain-containing protein [Chitinispirillaceae bacterium]
RIKTCLQFFDISFLQTHSIRSDRAFLGAPTERDIRSVIAGISPASYARIKEEIREFISRVIRIVDDDTTSDRVYSLNLQLFPLSKPDDKGA